jgi:hypothetical protein
MSLAGGARTVQATVFRGVASAANPQRTVSLSVPSQRALTLPAGAGKVWAGATVGVRAWSLGGVALRAGRGERSAAVVAKRKPLAEVRFAALHDAAFRLCPQIPSQHAPPTRACWCSCEIGSGTRVLPPHPPSVEPWSRGECRVWRGKHCPIPGRALTPPWLCPSPSRRKARTWTSW